MFQESLSWRILIVGEHLRLGATSEESWVILRGLMAEDRLEPQKGAFLTCELRL